MCLIIGVAVSCPSSFADAELLVYSPNQTGQLSYEGVTYALPSQAVIGNLQTSVDWVGTRIFRRLEFSVDLNSMPLPFVPSAVSLSTYESVPFQWTMTPFENGVATLSIEGEERAIAPLESQLQAGARSLLPYFLDQLIITYEVLEEGLPTQLSVPVSLVFQ